MLPNARVPLQLLALLAWFLTFLFLSCSRRDDLLLLPNHLLLLHFEVCLYRAGQHDMGVLQRTMQVTSHIVARLVRASHHHQWRLLQALTWDHRRGGQGKLVTVIEKGSCVANWEAEAAMIVVGPDFALHALNAGFTLVEQILNPLAIYTP